MLIFHSRSFGAYVTELNVRRLILENCHRRVHSLETEALVEAFFAGNTVQNDFFVVRRKFDEFLDNEFAQTLTLILWKQRYVAYVGAVTSIGKRPTNTDDALAVTHKAAEHAVVKRRFQASRIFRAQRCTLI